MTILLALQIKQLLSYEAELVQQQNAGDKNYDILTTEEKNRLWKLVLKKATLYRTPEGELSVHIYPKLPK